ncbi:MAG: hypothetical protein U0L79_09825 [Lachnospiraceae bacterium]|nr:hypothetical protein [Lachnospiraceae bacterium]
MAYIKVNHSEFEKAASKIDEYVTSLNIRMTVVQSDMEDLSVAWQGGDAEQYKNQVKKLDDEDSVHYNFKSSLESYADFLRYAGKQYKDAQARAVNRANNLF